jgi:PAS domain S-box-containing protein
MSPGREENPLQVERYGQKNNLPGGEVNVYRVDRKVVFGTEKGLRRFDPGSRSFVPDSTFGGLFADTLYSVSRIAEDTQGRAWIAGGKEQVKVHVLSRQANGAYTEHDTPLLRISDFGPLWAIYPEQRRGDVVWLGGDAGLVRYDGAIDKDYRTDFAALVRRVRVNGDSLVYGGMADQAGSSASSVFDYQHNALRFDYAATSYEEPSGNQFQYFLEGFGGGWSEWTKETTKEYTNLPAGEYVFRIRAKNIFDQLSSEDAFGFKVLPPWFQSRWAYAGYLALFLAGLVLIDRVQRSRLIKREMAKAKLREAEIISAKNIELHEKNEQLEFVLQKLQLAQDSLIDSESRFRAVAESANDAIITSDITGKITFWNKHAETIFGYSRQAAVGQPLTMLMPERHHKAHREGMDRFLRTGKAHIIGHVVELEAVRKDGSEFPIELTLASWETPDGKYVTGIIRDITKRRQEQAELERTRVQLFQSEKLASLGKLTAGIAHEINTPLGAIKSNADVTVRCVAKLEKLLHKASTVAGVSSGDTPEKYVKLLKSNGGISLTACDRITKILNSLKNFTRLDEAQYQRVDLHDSIENTLTLMEHEMTDKIKVVKEYGDIPLVACHPGELNQVFMNLLTNAVQAIEGKGTITIRTLMEHGNVHIAFADTGAGIAPERMKNLFDPRFTAKQARVKAGLGLYTSYNLIQKHHGQIQVRSDVGIGSTFTVILPVATDNKL